MVNAHGQEGLNQILEFDATDPDTPFLSLDNGVMLYVRATDLNATIQYLNDLGVAIKHAEHAPPEDKPIRAISS